ncbi:MBL fold metallo-hydrolase [Hyphobacterium marinum]|uniref:MBL fold metallo-hydrolase n=1 Tax=Hyphobacterium marinum TaxID=3116574 RepID=A0ABU7LXY1_9PROT|nr:MBL fold metallo-hydrolase [Hyphobacterium sp. Y6023]MEE2566419.1 MBL fold metallo-hydrolase [Hyphobacterium sp. Y6023]
MLFSTAPALADEPVELTFVANEGVLIRQAETAVMIDTLTWNSYDGTYALPSEAATQAMINGEAPFDGVDALLFTHLHGDHSHAEGAVQFLAANSDAVVAASVQITAAMTAEPGGSDADIAERIITVPLTSDRVGPEGILQTPSVEGAWLFHREGVDNITWHVDIGGVSILHLGDTQPQQADFSAWAETEFDVILYPYWFALMPRGQAFLASRPEARAIAFHIPAATTEQQIRQALGDAEYLHTEGETIVLREGGE